MTTDEHVRLIAAETLVHPAVIRRIRLTVCQSAKGCTAADRMATMLRLLADHPSMASRSLWSVRRFGRVEGPEGRVA